ncbi:MAG: helix-turn-helix domain-containing protein [Streptosporangiaceae bacterium]
MRYRRRPARPHHLGQIRLVNMTDTRPTGHGDRWRAIVDGQRLRELRLQRGLSQVELAQLAEVSPYTVSKLERQQTTACRSRTLARLAAALGEPPSAIVPNVGRHSD